MEPPRFSLRTTLLLITGVLTLMIAGLSLANLHASALRLSDVERLKEASLISDQLFNATSRLTLEHDVALSMLRAPDIETVADLRSRLIESRRETDSAFRDAQSSLQRYPFAGLSELRTSLALQMANIESLRPGLDAAFDMPVQQRPAALSEDWSREVSTLVSATQASWIGFIARFVDIDPLATLHLRFKHQLRIIRDETGLERALIGQLIAENAHPTPEQFADLLHAQGAADGSWSVIRTIAEQSRLDGAIAEAYADARSHYDTMRSMTRGMFQVSRTRHRAAYPIDANLWFELSLQASETFQSLTDATVSATQSYLDGLIANARSAIVLQSLILFVAALLCAASFWIVIWQVIAPVNAMIDALMRATRGEKVDFRASESSPNEVGKLGDVLHAFQETMDEVRRTAAELDRSQSRLSAVVNHAVDGLVTLDATGRILSFNPACERIFGYSAAEAIGEPITLLAPRLYAEGEYGDLPSFARDASTRGEEPGAHEFMGRRKNKRSFAMDLSISSYRLEGQTQYALFLRDVTRRKTAEEALIGYTHALERSNKELDDFAYIASHDLKEPLRGIHNHSRFLLEDNGEKLDEESSGRLRRLVHLSQRMERLINDLLYFSRIGRQNLAVQVTDLGEAVHDIEDTLADFLEEHGAKIVVQGMLPPARCDKTRVTELLRNLITNGVKYNDNAEKRIEVGYVAAMAHPNGGTARKVYFVKDNGRGIEPDFHQEVFRIFKRLQAAGGKEEGTGVGLTFVKKIVERHGGEVWVDSKLGEGATFYFTLEASSDDRKLSTKAA